jgi:hypothetical protein
MEFKLSFTFKWQREKFTLEGNKWDLISKFGVTLPVPSKS